MPSVLVIPDLFSDPLKDSEFLGPVYDFVHKVSTILSDNKLPFFPNYTDHGVEHVGRVLATMSRHLIPENTSELLNAGDSAVLITASLLHDIAMYMQPAGFLALIHKRTAHEPVPWFDAPNHDRSVDKPWDEEWENYVSEVQRFNDSQFINILGRIPDADDLRHWTLEDLPAAPRSWREPDYLLIGEFLRRHHGRLAHEIALYGFPGLSEDDFPVLDKTLSQLANLSGVVARSHALSLRDAAEYLKYRHRGVLRPRDVLAVYHMALLRVADYLQIDASRAPRILFKLRSPQVSKTIDEWNRHGAVTHISYFHEDPYAIKIEIDPHHSLATHVQLSELISDLQKELDISSSVLSAVYGPRTQDGLNVVRLKKSRIDSNIADSALLDALSYFPIEARLDADPGIFSLMIEPLYGFFPEIAIRELIQNGVDAVLECRKHCGRRGMNVEALSFYKQDCDVLVDVAQQSDGSWVLTVADKGIGMKPDTVAGYFLKAGASFRESQAWRESFVNREGRTTVNRSGRFGVGAFAAFLLGDSLEVSTRHVDDGQGVSFVATRDSEMVELTRAHVPVGTSISVRLSNAASQWVEKHLDGKSWDWFGLEDPSVRRQIRKGGETTLLRQSSVLTREDLAGKHAGWGIVRADGFGDITWGFEKLGPLFCNGIAIGGVEKSSDSGENRLRGGEYSWDDDYPFARPLLAVNDPEAALPLTLLRDRLVGSLPFEQELKKDILLDYIAFILAKAPQAPLFAGRLSGAYACCYPLLKDDLLVVPWFCSGQGVGPFDRSLIKSLNVSRIVVSGELFDAYVDATVWPHLSSSLSDDCLGVALFGFLSPSTLRMLNFKLIEDKPLEDNIVKETLSSLVHNIPYDGRDEVCFGGAKICAQSVENGGILSFGTGDSFAPVTDLAAILTERQGIDMSARYDEERLLLFKAEQKQSVPFAAELLLSFDESDSILGQLWFDIVGPTLVPFDAEKRRRLLDKVKGRSDMKGRIEKWEALSTILSRLPFK